MQRDAYGLPGPVILPSILAADFTRLGEEVADADRAGGDALHVDVMDGHFVETISFGPAICAAARRASSSAYLDCHLMVTNPEELAPQMVDAGANGITFHAELADNVRRTLGDLCSACGGSGVDVGVAINPLTPAEAVYPILDDVRLVLVMSVVPGAGGQSFMPEVLEKCQAIKRRLGPGQRLEIDGGIAADTIGSARDAGVDWFVAGSSVFGHADRAAAIRALRAAME